MRPVALRISGFTCYREEQEIDFRRLDLFAISGPTGAGKTTILDAMVFALYGEVPRMGARGLSELISLGRDRASVVFEFEIGDDAYRVVRVLRRRGSGNAQLERREGGVYRPLAGAILDVERQVKTILGIDANTFLKSVMLPQGQFAEFLRSAPRDRRDILRALLQLDIYERMREKATTLARDAQHEADKLRSRLADLADATPQNVAEVEARMGELDGLITSAGQAAELAQHRLGDLERIATLQADLRRAKARLDKLVEQETAIAKLERQRERALAAAPLLGRIEALAEVRREYERESERARDLEAQLSKRQHFLAECEDREKAANAAAEEIQPLREACVRLRQLEPLLDRKDECERQAKAAKRAIEDAADKVKAEKARLDHHRGEAKEQAENLEEITRALHDLAHDPERVRRLEEMVPNAQELATRVSDADRKERAYLKADGEVTSAEASLKDAKDFAAETTRIAEHAALVYEQEREALDRARRDHAAHDLRGSIRPGDACPVCLQVVPAVPPSRAPDDLAAASAREASAREEERKCRQAAEQARDALTAAEGAVRNARNRRDEVARELAEIKEAIAACEAQIRERLAELRDLDGATLAKTVIARLDEARKRAARHDHLERERRDVEQRLKAAEHGEQLAQQALGRWSHEHGRATSELEASQAERAQIVARIQEAAPSGDLVAERERLEHRIEELERGRSQAADAVQRARLAAKESEAEYAGARRKVSELESRVNVQTAELQVEIGAAGFRDVDDVRAAALSAEKCEEIARRVSEWRAAVRAEEAQVATLSAQAPAGEVSGELLAVARREAGDARTHHLRLAGEHGELRSKHAELASKLEKAAALGEQLAAQGQVHEMYNQLAQDLRSDRLQAHLLDETFRDIVRGASERLFELSGNRYTLTYSDDDFFVIDHDNARERRRANTLSGGETFLTALALALQLSEQIQRAAGAVRLDSLFIDEGFGSLDPETLGTVTEAIEQLGRGQRMVGIITHVPDLTAALPARLEVVRGPDGSKISVVLDA